MKRYLLQAVYVSVVAAAFGMTACNKDDNRNKYEVWTVHNYCEPQKPGVYCAQDDTTKITLCCGEVDKYKVNQLIIISQNTSIIYYQRFLSLDSVYTY
jgi:hypothetical protein